MNKEECLEALATLSQYIYKSSQGTLNAKDCYELKLFSKLIKVHFEGEISKKPYFEFNTWHCPTCNSYDVCDPEYGVMYNYCPNCGQRLDWSDMGY